MKYIPSVTSARSTAQPRSANSFAAFLRLLVLSAALLATGSRAAALLQEGFEGTGYENSGWIVPPQSLTPPNPDYSATPLVGSQSLRCTGVSFVQRPFVNNTEFFAYCQVRWLQWSDFRVVLDWLNADQTATATVYADFGRRLQVIHGGVAQTGTTIINDNVTYHLWVEWTKGSGTDGTMKLFVSTTGFKPATPEASVTAGQGGALALLDLGPFGANADVVYDNLIISDAPIGNNPSANAPPTISDIANQSILPDTTLGPVAFTIGDAETPAANLSVTASSSNAGLVPNSNITLAGAGASRSLTVVPLAGQTGATTIAVSVNDGTNTATDTFVLTVSAANTPPTISDVANQTINQDTVLGPIAFTVGDAQTAPGDLIVSASSSNAGLVPAANIGLGGSGANRTVTITPAAGQTGSALITLTVNDGQASAADTFILTVNSVGGGGGTFVLEEGFEGPGYENPGWNPSTGTPNPDYTIFPLQGQQSLFLASGSSINRAFSLSTQFGLYCRVRFPDAFAQFTSVFQWWTFGFGSQVAGVTTEFGDRLQLTHGAANATAVIPTIIPNTTYHIWVDWNASTGGPDGTMRLYISEDANKPAAPHAALNNGVGMNPAIMVVGPYAGGNGVIVDAILVSDAPIGSNPGGNAAPSISAIPNATILPNTVLGPVSFNIADTETPAEQLLVTASSSNPALVPPGAITLGGIGATRTITVVPAAGELGTANITVIVDDGTNTATDVFALTVSTSAGNGEFVLDEGFEGAGYENTGWNTGTGTPNPDYTGIALNGAQSLFLGSGASINRVFPLNNEFNLYCRAYWPDSFVQFTSIFQWWTPGFGGQVAGVVTEFGDRLQLTHGSAQAVAVIPSIIPNTPYHLWVEWSGNSGASDGTMRLYISPTGDKPAVPQALLNNGLGANAALFVVGPYSGGNGLVIDTVLVSENPIGSNPGQNLPPTISAIADQAIDEDTATGAIPFTIGDDQTSASSLVVSASSSNPALVPDANLILGGSAANRTITATPLPDQFGSTVVTVRVSDGEATNATSFTLVVNPLPETPVVTWADPAAIFHGTPLGAAQFNATANVTGTFTYSIDAGAVLPVGNDQTLAVTFTPDDLVNYLPVTLNVSIDVLPWSHADIGTVGLAGDATFDGGTFTIAGSGTDIWDFADGFHYAYRAWAGDADIIARVAGIENTDPWAKAGIMIRESQNTDSAHAYICVTPGSGTAFQRRQTTGTFSLHTPGAFVAAPQWVRLIRSGNTFQGYTSSDGLVWNFVGEDTIPMTTEVSIGIAVTAHNNTLITTGTVTNIRTTLPATPPQLAITAPGNGALLAPGSSLNIEVGAAANGATIQSVQVFANGALLGETAAQPYAVAWNNLARGTYTLTARAVYNNGLVASSAPVSVNVVTPLPAPWQHQDIGTVGIAGDAAAQGSGFTISGGGVDIWDAADGFHFVHQTWTGNGEIIARVDALENTNPWAKAGVMFRESLDAGSPHAFMAVTPGNGAAFQRRPAANLLSLHTAGALVAAPHWVRLVRLGDQFTGYTSPDGIAWTLVGTDTVPMAATLHVGLAVTAHDNTVATAAVVSEIALRLPRPDVALTAPLDGAVITTAAPILLTAAVAPNGNDIATVEFYSNGALVGEVFYPPYEFEWTGAAVGGHTLVARVITFEDLAVASSPVTITVIEPLPAPWTAQDVGTVGTPGSATHSAGTFTVRASGDDIWNNADAFHFVHQSWIGDGEIVAQVTGIGATDPWAKAGVMFRETLAGGSRHVLMAVTPGNGTAFQRRTDTDGVSTHTPGAFVAAPQWVRLVRLGNIFQGFTSADGINWTLVGTETIAMNAALEIGLAVTAHNNSLVTTGTFSDVLVRIPPPSIAISAPANGAVFIAPATITVTADVAANGNAISAVQFFSNGAFVGELLAPPYTLTRTGVTVGNYSLAVRVVTTSGLAVDSAPVNVSVVAVPSAPANLTSTAVATNRINLAWVPGSANHTGFVIERSVNGGAFAVVANVSAGTLSFANTGLAANTPYAYRIRATNSFGSSAYSATATAQTFLPRVRINFQPATAAVPSGYLADAGATFAARGNGQTYGWNLNNSSTARDRNSLRSPDQRYDTLQHMQVAGAGSAWELAVPNGSYSVFLVSGDANAIDSVYRVNVEGILTVSGTPTTTTRWHSGTRTVAVTDGRLTISNGAGAVNNKVCFIEVTQVAPPAAALTAAFAATEAAAEAKNDTMRVQMLGRDEFGRVKLLVPGQPFGTYAIETSADLFKWSALEVVPDSDGSVSIESESLDRTEGRYFRAIPTGR